MSRKEPRKGPRRNSPKHGPYAGPVACLRCDREFQSWDRRQNRLCPLCRNELDQEPSEEPRYSLPPPVRRSRNRDNR
jgi:predicted amidophosphoribosyltransferase